MRAALFGAFVGWASGVVLAIVVVFYLWHTHQLPPGTWFGLFMGSTLGGAGLGIGAGFADRD